MGVKSITDEAIGTATTMAFAIPEAGAGIAAVLALTGFLFDLCYPPDPSAPPPPAPATQADLENAVLAITDAIFQGSKDTIAARLAAIADDFDDNLDLFTKHFVPQYMGSAAGQAVMTQDTQDNLRDYLLWDAPGSAWKDLNVIAAWVEQGKPEVRDGTIGIHALAASLAVNYLKLGFSWELRRSIDADTAAGNLSSLMGDPKDADVIAAREDFLRTSSYAGLLHHFDGWADYAQKWVTDKLPTDDQVSTLARRTLGPMTGRDQEYKNLAMQAAMAAARTQLITQSGVDEGDVDNVAACIDIWRDAKTDLTAPPKKV